ncbi:MAG: hypothetical protein R3335_09270, partial [Anaerolineales bacterium]|nr:hypothetical protein [Anaerolineales bacterium]
QITFPILQDRVDQVVLLSEAELFEGARWMLAQHQYLIELSAAATVAACLTGQVRAAGPAVVVLSGRNVSLETIRLILAQ